MAKAMKMAEIAKYNEKRAMAYVELLRKLGYIIHVHDGNCPKCKFPETIFVRDQEGKLVYEMCSNYCGWGKKK